MSDDIHPFRIEIPQADLGYLHGRLSGARWPDEAPGAGWTEFPRGLHFPAMEAPAELAADLRAFFAPLQ
jgi:hypothetical protein